MIEQIKEINVADFSAEQFESNYYKKSIPLIVRGLQIGNPDDNWNMEYFKTITGFYENEVHVRVYETRDLPNFFINKGKLQDDGYIDKGADMKIIDALNLVMSDPDETGTYHNILEGNIKELIDSIDLPGFMSNKTSKAYGNIWIGNGNLSGIHFDGYNNFFFQKKGAKKFIIFEPANYFYLYPAGPNTASFAYLQKIDEERYPLYKYAVPIEVTLEEGDFLYLPPFWWHQVEGYNPYISINYWGIPSLDQCLCQPGYYFIMKHFELGNLIDLAAAFFENKSNWGLSIRKIAHHLMYLGHNWIAALVLVAALERYAMRLCRNNGFELNVLHTKRISELEEKMNRSEMNYNNIVFENLAEERLYELIQIIHANSLLEEDMIDAMYTWVGYIRLAKMKDNLLLTHNHVEEFIDRLSTVEKAVEVIVA